MTTVMTVQFDFRRMQLDAVELGLSANALARLAHVDQTAISRFFKGQTSIRPKTALKLAEALGHPVSRYVVEHAEAVSR